MKIFHYNILNIYGEKGKAWLNELPRLVAAISSKHGLRDLKAVTNLTYNYVLLASKAVTNLTYNYVLLASRAIIL